MESRSIINPGVSECSGAASFCSSRSISHASIFSTRSFRLWFSTIDRPLHPRNLRIRRLRRARLVFFMPKLEVGPVLRHRQRHQAIRARLDRQLALRLMQAAVISSCIRAIKRASSIAVTPISANSDTLR